MITKLQGLFGLLELTTGGQPPRMMDGKLLLVTNVADLAPAEIVQRYKSLADIERGFRVLKSEIEIAPVYHRLPERIRAHACIWYPSGEPHPACGLTVMGR